MADNKTTMVARKSDLERLDQISRYVNTDPKTPYYETLDFLADYFIQREIKGESMEVSVQ